MRYLVSAAEPWPRAPKARSNWDRTALFRGLPFVTISSKFRIESILSPAEPQADEQTHVSTAQSNVKRKHADAFTAPGAAPLGVELATPLDVRSQTSARSDTTTSEPGRAYLDDNKHLTAARRKEAAQSARPRPPMRSSIACLRCRRSKIKCDNDGGNSPCETCIKAGQECQYPDGHSGRARRSEPAGSQGEKEDSPERKRVKRADSVPSLDPQRATAYAAEVLSYPFITIQVWEKVFAIFKTHYAAELPFLHLPTIKDAMSRRHEYFKIYPSLNLVLLGLLALAAPFYPELAKYSVHVASLHGVKPRDQAYEGDLSSAGDFFANALITALGPLKTSMSTATVERVQALLILGLYEWNRRYEDSETLAWTYVGLATRLAYMLQIGLDDKTLLSRDPVSQGGQSESTAPSESVEVAIAREIRRRTMFSCLVLDRMMAYSKERPSMIRSEDLDIQLPCPEPSFSLAQNLSPTTPRPLLRNRLLNKTDNSILSLFIQLVDLWGDIKAYSIECGHPDEEAHARFLKLRDELDFFAENISGTFPLSRQSYYRHENSDSPSMYVSLHMLMCASQVVLHREYLPFLPPRHGRGKGDTEHLHRRGSKTEIDDYVTRVFRAAREIVDLLEICRDKLPMTPLTLYSTWSAGFMGLYAHHFPQMDSHRYMTGWADGGRRGDEDADVYQGSLTGAAYQTMMRMVPYVHSADAYVKCFREVNEFMKRAKHLNLTIEKLSIRSGSDRGGVSLGGAAPSSQPKPSKAPDTSPVLLSDIPGAVTFKTVNDLAPVGPESPPQLVSASQPRISLFEIPESEAGLSNLRKDIWTKIRQDQPLDEVAMAMLESQRIATVLNDLQEFSGVGAVGARERESGVSSGGSGKPL